MAYPPLDITSFWAQASDSLIVLNERFPDDKLRWSPQPRLWTFGQILLHVAEGRDNWLAQVVRDGGGQPTADVTAPSKQLIEHHLRRSWHRLERFLAVPEHLAAEYEEPGRAAVTGHWIAFHLLEHDIIHRTDLLHYLSLLDIDPALADKV